MGNFQTHAVASLIVSGFLTVLIALSGNRKPHQLAMIFLGGFLAGTTIDLDHFIWGRIYFGDWQMLTGCVAQFKACLMSPADVWATQYGTMPSVAIKIRNAVHILSAVGGTGFALLVSFWKPEWVGGLKFAMVVFTSAVVHVAIDTLYIWKPLIGS